MIEIVLKIDKEINMTYKTGNEDMAIASQPKTVNEGLKQANKKQIQRAIDNFMYLNIQYIRAGDVYIEVTPQDTITPISRTKYYNIRKKANDHAIQ